jgi:hypothetical protein
VKKNENSVVPSSNDSHYMEESMSDEDKNESSDDSHNNSESEGESKPKADKKARLARQTTSDSPYPEKDQFYIAIAEKGESKYLKFVNSSPCCVFIIFVMLTGISLGLSLQNNYFYKDMGRQSPVVDFFDAEGASLDYITVVQAENYVLAQKNQIQAGLRTQSRPDLNGAIVYQSKDRKSLFVKSKLLQIRDFERQVFAAGFESVCLAQSETDSACNTEDAFVSVTQMFSKDLG